MIRIMVIGSGATMAISAAVNMVAVRELIGEAEEQSLGLKRSDLMTWYSFLLAAGLLLMWLGFRRRRPKVVTEHRRTPPD